MRNLILLFSIIFCSFFLVNQFVFATDFTEGLTGVTKEAYGEDASKDVGAKSEVAIYQQIDAIIAIVLGTIGTVIFIIIVYAGFLWTTAGGNQDQVNKAKQWMINAFIGLFIVAVSYYISDFVLGVVIGN